VKKVFLFSFLVMTALNIKAQTFSDYVKRGNSEAKIKNYQAAILHYDSALVLKPDYTVALNMKGLCLAALDKTTEACELFSKSKKLGDASAQELINLYCISKKSTVASSVLLTKAPPRTYKMELLLTTGAKAQLPGGTFYQAKSEYLPGKGSITVDEQVGRIKGKFHCYCEHCEITDHTFNLDFGIEKTSDSTYIVLDSNPPNILDHFEKRQAIIYVSERLGQINFYFPHLGIGDGSFMLKMVAPYRNINHAIDSVDIDAVREFISKGVDLNASYESHGRNESPLNYVCDLSHSDRDLPYLGFSNIEPIVKLLLLKGANPNITDEKGYTPLMKSINNIHLGIFNLLLQFKADAQIKAKDGNTALKLAKSQLKIATKYHATTNGYDEIIGQLKMVSKE